MIHVEHLRKRFGDIRALDGISFEVARGEVVGLLGPNGAGKTTTMRIVTGYLAADGGAVTVDGIPVDGDAIGARQRIGYLPENAPLYDDMEVTEYLGYVAKLRKIDAGLSGARIDEMVTTCGLDQVAGRRIGTLSKGFRQRTGLASAMIHHPPILILDEPTSGLDPNQIVQIRGLIKRIGQERTVVLSTHILQEVEATCSRAIIIDAGNIVGQGTIEDLRQAAAAHSQYTIAARTSREHIEAELTKLPGLAIDEWITDPQSSRQRLTLKSADGVDRSEEIFRWAAQNDITLSELSKSGVSLEQVFRDLTQKP